MNGDIASWPRRAASVAATVALACAGCGAQDPTSDASGRSPGSSPAQGAAGAGADTPEAFGNSDAPVAAMDPSDPDPTRFAECGGDEYVAEKIPQDLFVMLDRSGSMQSPGGAWDPVTQALKGFMALPETAGIGIGLGLFPWVASLPPPTFCMSDAQCGPYGPCDTTQTFATCADASFLSCVPADYAKPIVPIMPLPDVASAMAAAIDAQTQDGGTPMAPALEGAIMYAREHMAAHPGRGVTVVLATDGSPNGCDVEAQRAFIAYTENPTGMPLPPDLFVKTVADLAAAGFGSAPLVKTFVISIGAGMAALNQEAANRIAAAGGSGQAFFVDTAGDPVKDFLDALDRIASTVGCTFAIPTPEGRTPNPEQLNFTFTAESGMPELFPRAPDAAGCGDQAAWFYDVPAAPTQINLCPAACDRVTAGSGRVEIVVGCQTVLL